MVWLPGVLPRIESSGEVCGHSIGSRLGLIGRTPMFTLSWSVMPSLFLMSMAYSRQSDSQIERASSLAMMVPLVRVVSLVATSRAATKLFTVVWIESAWAGVSMYIAGLAVMPLAKAWAHRLKSASLSGT